MKKGFNTILFLSTLAGPTVMLKAQGMKMGEVLLVCNSTLKKDINHDALQEWISKDIGSSWSKRYPGTTIHLFHADRGDRNGEFLLIIGATRIADRGTLPAGSPFTEKVFPVTNAESKRPADFLNTPDSHTEYRLIGPENFRSYPVAGILGIHYIKVKPERSASFEKFVTEKLHPAVAQLFPDLQLLYYKAVAGENKGEYVAIFTIESVAARDKYWPSGAPETEALKKGFVSLKKLALELGDYLVEGSYLKPESGGAAAYFESTRWTDFVYSSSGSR